MRFKSGGSNPEQCRRFGYRSAINDSKGSSGFDLISDALPFGRLWYGEPNATSNAIDYAKFYSRTHHAQSRACFHSREIRIVLPSTPDPIGRAGFTASSPRRASGNEDRHAKDPIAD